MVDKIGFQYAQGMQTSITLEEAGNTSEYIANQRYTHGYAQDDLLKRGSSIDSLYLLFTGELPTKKQKSLFESLYISLMNLGPRDTSIRAAMQSGISKCNLEHILPIGALVSGGEKYGANCVLATHKFIEENLHHSVEKSAVDIIKNNGPELGFTKYFGSIDEISNRHFLSICDAHQSDKLQWVSNLVMYLNKQQYGIVPAGLCASICLELGFSARYSAVMFQIMTAPGIVAHGVEQLSQPITSAPMLNDKDYYYEG